MSLIVTGLFFAAPLHRMRLLSLPDFFRQRYNAWAGVVVAALCVTSFIILVAGNFAGLGIIVERSVGIPAHVAIPVIAALITLYSCAGGLFGVTWNDILQGGVAIAGLLIAFIWLWQYQPAAVQHGIASASQFSEGSSLRFWATLGALALGDVVALDFMERVFAARTPTAARVSCLISGTIVICVGIVVGLTGTALAVLAPETDGNVVTAVQQVLPPGIAMLFIVGLVAAGISTVDGALMACSVAVSRNVLQPLIPSVVTPARLLNVARLTTVPVTSTAAIIAIVYPIPGDLLVLAFDAVFAGSLVPLTLGIYWKRATAEAALWAMIVPSLLRVALEIEVARIPPQWSGLQTLVPPVLSLIIFVSLSLRRKL